jgi:RNA polymerase sigma factor for flagellar operon FliA
VNDNHRVSTALTDDDRAALARNHRYLASRAAALIHRRVAAHIERTELVALGEAGLVEAANRFDPGRGVTFATFAWHRVHGAIIDGLRAQTLLPRRVWRRLVELRSARALLEHAAANDDTARAMAAIDDELSSIRRIRVVSLETVSESSNEPADAADAVERLDSETRACRVAAAIAALPAAERDVVRTYYWTDNTLAQAGATLGFSKSWSSRLHARAIARMRTALERDGIRSAS